MTEFSGKKNKLNDLNDHLFAQLERLSDEDLSEEELLQEARRATAICSVAEKIIDNGNLAFKVHAEFGGGQIPSAPAFLGIEHKDR